MPADPLRSPAHRASQRARAYWTVRALTGWIVLGVVEAVVLLGSGAPVPVAAPVAGVTLLLAVAHLVVMPQWRYRVHRWELTETAAYTQAGWLVQERRIAPLVRVQTVDTRRGPFELAFGLSNVTITTASARGPLLVRALDQAVADDIVRWLTDRAHLTGGDGT